MKTCTRCAKTLPLSEFRRVPRLSGGVDIYCRLCRREIGREWSKNNHEKELERYRKYREKNREVVREKAREMMRRRRDKNREIENQKLREYRKSNPEKAAAWEEKKKAKRRGALEADVVTRAQWEKIKAKFNHCCAYRLRQTKRLEKDHVVPLSRGGSHTESNIVPACKSCNCSKNAKDVYQWVAEKHGRLI